ncbi:hypothetical protein IQ267_21900 [filamentous cyanobacterium LEGE 07170]|nr:hypothetical protein [filamentous cyanobacterium LEGE 07170]
MSHAIQSSKIKPGFWLSPPWSGISGRNYTQVLISRIFGEESNFVLSLHPVIKRTTGFSILFSSLVQTEPTHFVDFVAATTKSRNLLRITQVLRRACQITAIASLQLISNLVEKPNYRLCPLLCSGHKR